MAYFLCFLYTQNFYNFFSSSTDAQRQGLSLIYDMAFSGYQNFDFDLAMKVLHLLKVCGMNIMERICNNYMHVVMNRVFYAI